MDRETSFKSVVRCLYRTSLLPGQRHTLEWAPKTTRRWVSMMKYEPNDAWSFLFLVL
jgi:hypothetical protein